VSAVCALLRPDPSTPLLDVVVDELRNIMDVNFATLSVLPPGETLRAYFDLGKPIFSLASTKPARFAPVLHSCSAPRDVC
jgi:hypothetical protein